MPAQDEFPGNGVGTGTRGWSELYGNCVSFDSELGRVSQKSQKVFQPVKQVFKL